MQQFGAGAALDGDFAFADGFLRGVPLVSAKLVLEIAKESLVSTLSSYLDVGTSKIRRQVNANVVTDIRLYHAPKFLG